MLALCLATGSRLIMLGSTSSGRCVLGTTVRRSRSVGGCAVLVVVGMESTYVKVMSHHKDDWWDIESLVKGRTIRARLLAVDDSGIYNHRIRGSCCSFDSAHARCS
jgi:hypothetical protein